MRIEFKELFTVESLQTIRDLADVIWPETFEKILSPEQIKYMMKMMYAPEVQAAELADGVHFEVINIDNTPAGYLVYSAYKEEPHTAKLHKLYLQSTFHGQGIGQQMLDHAQNQCRKLGFQYILLTVNKHNDRAIKAYCRNGFIKVNEACVPIGGGFFMDDYIMKKAL